MTVEVIIGHGDADDDHRKAAREWVTRWWRSRCYKVTTAVSASNPWVKADAYNEVASRSTADVLVIADADVWAPTAQVAKAIEAAALHGWAVPAHEVHRLSPDATLAALELDPADMETPADPTLDVLNGCPRRHDLLAGGGLLMIARGLWDQVGGFDPRFIGWGGEDYSLGCALRTYSGHNVHVTRGRLWHLWHPLAEDNGKGTRGADALAFRYRRAKFRPDDMRALIAEWRQL